MDDTRFVREIKMQPSALKVLAEYYNGNEGKSLLKIVADEITSKRKIIFTGMGTSLYAPYIIVNELVEIHPSIEIWDAGELLHFGLQGIKGDEIIIAISQSGESFETRRIVEEIKDKVTVISIVNNLSSFMGRNSHFVLPIRAGKEASISTKTYTNTLSVLLLLSTYLNKKNIENDIELLQVTSSITEKNLEEINNKSKQAVNFLGNINDLHIVARGSDLVTARQWSLIIKEGVGVLSEALSGGLFRHGPIEMAGKGHSVIFILSERNKPELTMQLAEETNNYGSKTLVISDKKEYGSSNMKSIFIESPTSRFYPIVCAPFIELFIHEMAKKKGKEAGIFTNTRKITDRE